MLKLLTIGSGLCRSHAHTGEHQSLAPTLSHACSTIQ